MNFIEIVEYKDSVAIGLNNQYYYETVSVHWDCQ